MRKFFNTKPKQGTTDQRPSPLRRWSFLCFRKSNSCAKNPHPKLTVSHFDKNSSEFSKSSKNPLRICSKNISTPVKFSKKSSKFHTNFSELQKSQSEFHFSIFKSHFSKSQNPYPNSNFSLKKNSFRPIIVSSSAFLFTFLTSFVISSLFTSPSSSHTENLVAHLSASDYYINLSSTALSSGLNLELSTTPSGSYASAKDTVSVSTNSPSGFSLYLSAVGSNNNLTNLSDPSAFIAPTSGTSTSPSPLETNSWGYAVPNTIANPTSFDSSYTTPVPANTSLWAAVPIPEHQALIQTTTTSSDTTPSTTDIYYGVKANLSLPSGNYGNTISYTALTESTSSSSAASIAPSYTVNLSGGEKVIVTTDLSVPQGTNLGAVTVTIGGSTCTSPTTSILSTSIVTITCIAPAKSAGDYDVVVEIPSYGKTYTIYNGFSYKALYNYTLSYSANGGTNPPTSQTATNISNTSYEFTITSSYPTRTGYNFKGWSTSSSSTTVSYTSGNKITLNSTNPTRTLYAVWEDARKLTDLTYMQEMESKICTDTAIGTSTTLTDKRDNKTYTVKKLSDGKCWMTQNLALTGSRTLTSANSDVTSNFTLPAVNTSTWCTTQDSTCYNQALHRTNPDNSSYGGYYNWYAATAGTGTYEKTSGNATSSICPKGWRLPTGGSDGEFQILYTAVGSNSSNMHSTSGGNPGFNIFSGIYNGVSFYGVGTFGYYWSSTANDNIRACYLSFNDEHTFTHSNNVKYNGSPIRCIAK